MRWRDSGTESGTLAWVAVGNLVRVPLSCVPKPRRPRYSLAPKHRGVMGTSRGCPGVCACLPVPQGHGSQALSSKPPPLPATCRVFPSPVACLPHSLGRGGRH